MKLSLFKIFSVTLVLLLAVMLATSCAYMDHGGTVDKDNCIHDYVTTLTEPECSMDGWRTKTCNICGNIEITVSAPALGHSFGEWTITVQPTEFQYGEKRRECSRCGLIQSDSILAHVHEMARMEGQTPGCDTIGWLSYEQCTLCDYNTKVIIEAVGHEWGEYASLGDYTHARTCTKNSEHTDVVYCSGGDYLNAAIPICDFCNTEYEFEVRPGNSAYGYYVFSQYQNSEKLQLLYRDLNSLAERFFVSDEDLVAESGYYIIGEFDIDKYGLTLEEAKAVWKIFYMSSPAYYWLDATIVATGSVVYLLVADEYARADERRMCDSRVEEMSFECSTLINETMTAVEKAMVITAYIVKGMDYAYESDGVTPVRDMWAHNIIGLAVNRYGVCEAYAKSFMYLCLQNGVSCLMGSGYSDTEAHSWNYVKLNDRWYGADITWTDNSGDEVVYDKLGLSADAFFVNHTPHSSTDLGVRFTYDSPELSDTNLELTALYKNGSYVGIYGSIGEAFDAMTDRSASYEINIGFYSAYEGAIKHTLDKARTPAVNSVKINGRSEYVGEGYLDINSVIVLVNPLTLASNLTLSNVQIEPYSSSVAAGIELDSYRLTLAGESVYLRVRVTGENSQCRVIAATSRGAYLYGGATVYRLTVTSDKVVFGADSYVKYCSKNGLYSANGAELKIDYYDR